MGRKKKNKSPVKSPAPKAVDVITASGEYYFDPSLILKENNGVTGRRPNKTVAASKSSDLSSKYLYVPCTIIKPIDEENSQNGTGKSDGHPFPGPTLVKTIDGALHKISDSTKLIPVTKPADHEGVPDVLNLPQINEASLLHTLRTRYGRDDIYTSAGPILISINPYKTVKQDDGQSIYCEERMLLYRKHNDYTAGPKAPHLYQIADRAYKALMDSVHSSTQAEHIEDEDAVMMLEYHKPPGSVRNQSIIISGESGAGKTEATKIIMAYLARITKRENKTNSNTSDGKMIAALEDRVLSSNPLLETFGNAQTLRNDNSSRFGKYIHIFFSTVTGAITGASISNYLLEKTRITSQVDGERNYHVFYQLLASANEEMLNEFGLQGGASSFNYLGHRSTVKDNVDQAGFRQTMECLDGIGLSPQEQKALFGTVAGVLHLGNIKFEENDDPSESFTESIGKCRVTDESRSSLRKACELLGLNEAQLEEAILTKIIVINGKSIKKAQTVPMAEDKRDALSKMTYSCLFLWLVNHINETLNRTSESSRKTQEGRDQIGCIGVLDIYGFESFEVNGYEQLLINYCNEKLQSHFNRHLFEVEQALYSNEGVDWSYITFNDNRPCLELIEGGSEGVGILNTLDDAWGGMGSASEKDSKFVAHLHRLFGKSTRGADAKKDSEEQESRHKHFITPKLGMNQCFMIKHYAGEVCYTVDGFVEKNMESLSKEIKDLGESSSHIFLKQVYSTPGIEVQNSTSQRSSIRGASVSWQFRSSLQTLVSDLERTQPHYVRCIKPNNTKSPGFFASADILKQLRYSGMMEAIRIRREGYALREDHETFYKRFSLLLGHEKLNMEDHQVGIVQLVKVLSKSLCVTDADWQIGHSKIFVRRVLADKLERLAKLRVHAASRTLGRFGRQVAKSRVSKLIATWIRFRLHMRAYYRRINGANKICATFKMSQHRKSFLAIRRKVVLVQAQQRRRRAAKMARKIRDPFFDVTLSECRTLLKQEHLCLEEAVASNNFQLAASIESKIAMIQKAIENKRPLTRAVLEQKINDAEKQISEAIERKAFSDCAPLQTQLDELISKRVDLPTIEELKGDILRTETELSEAVQKRDFAGAADCQMRLDKAKQRLLDVLKENDSDEDDGKAQVLNGQDSKPMEYECRSQLEEAIKSLTEQQKEKVKAKDFAGASFLQRRVDELENMRKFFPSADELQRDLKGLKSKLEEAVKEKNFELASKLDGDITKIKKKLDVEIARSTSASPVDESLTVILSDGTSLAFKSRFGLEKEIRAKSSLQARCVEEKEFKKAEKFQDDIDRLTTLRSTLPSSDELLKQINETKKDMEAATNAKDFSRADCLSRAIQDLEKKYSEEKQSEVLLVPSTLTAAKAVHRKGVTAAPMLPKTHAKLRSTEASVRSTPARCVSIQNASTAPSVMTTPANPSRRPSSISSINQRSVAKLRPAIPLTGKSDESILTIVKNLASKRANSAVIVDAKGRLAGIVTDTDITRRVVAMNVDPATTNVSEVMTPNPMFVSMADSALDALSTMVENRFRHLPVIDSEGSVVGLLDIAKCLNEAISKLEKVQEKSTKSTEDVVHQVVSQQGVGGAQAAALQALLGTLMSQAFGTQSAPTLRSLLAGKPCTIVSPETSLHDAGKVMAENRKAALVVDKDSGELVGIFGFKDMMNRAIAKELPLASTSISEVMTPSPEYMSPDSTVLEALQTMHDNHILTLPVCEETTGQVVGLVDVMDLIHGCGGARGWRSIFSKAMELEDSTIAFSTEGSNLAPEMIRMTEATSRPHMARLKLPENIPSTLEFDDIDINSAMDDRGVSRVFGPDDGSAFGDMNGTFKITDAKGRTHRIRCEPKLDSLFTAISEKAEIARGSFQVQYTDEDGDMVLITGDDDVREAWVVAQKTESKVAKLDVVFLSKNTKGLDSVLLIAGAASLIAVGASAFFVLNRGKK